MPVFARAVKLLAVGAGALLTSFSLASLAAAAPAPRVAPAGPPVIRSLALTRRALPSGGGTVVLHATTSAATSCELKLTTGSSAGVSFRHGTLACGPRLALVLRFSANASTSAADYGFSLDSRGSGGVASRSFRVTLGAGASRAPASDPNGTVGVPAPALVPATTPAAVTTPPATTPPATTAPALPPLTVLTTTLPAGVVGLSYSASLSASGGTAPYSWSLLAGALPSGLVLSAAGTITGVPTAGASSTFTLAVADASTPTSEHASATLVLGVALPTPTPAPVASATVPVRSTANWSGYVVAGGPFTAVSGTFNVPGLVASGSRTYASEWVGIDGVSNEALIQAGVDETYDPLGGGLSLHAWWEILPAAETFVPLPVAVGDEVSVTIDEVAASLWQIQITDTTSGAQFSTEQSYTGPATSAEWILEDPTIGNTLAPFGDYTPVVTFVGDHFTGPETSLTEDVLSRLGTEYSVPSTFDGSGFSVAYGGNAPPGP